MERRKWEGGKGGESESEGEPVVLFDPALVFLYEPAEGPGQERRKRAKLASFSFLPPLLFLLLAPLSLYRSYLAHWSLCFSVLHSRSSVRLGRTRERQQDS